MAAGKMDTEVRREQIAQAALGIIATQGMKGFGIAAIADRVGIVPSAIYRHFKSKDEIIDSVLDLIRDSMIGNVTAICEETADPLERLEKLVSRQIGMLHAIPAIPQIIFSGGSFEGMSDRKDKLHESIRRYLVKIREIILQGQKAGVIRADMDSEVLSLMLMGTVQQAMIMWFVSGGNFDVNKYAKKAWAFYKNAIAN
ncbi:MAG: TetR/AcrR family transcriptional regulator [bacterium]